MEEMDYDSEGTVTDPELTLPYGYDVEMDSEPEEENRSYISAPDKQADKRGSNLHCCWGLCTNDSPELFHIFFNPKIQSKARTDDFRGLFNG